MSLVSIIMTCHNGDKYLEQALISLKKQTYKNWELIFWDNKSTDNSAKIFKNFNDPRLKYFYNSEKTTLYKARNLSIQKAEGESTTEESIALAMTSRFGVGNAKFHYGGREGPTDTVYLGVYDADIFRQLGGFDESLERNQDYEFNIRIRESGNLVWFNPDLVVRYRPRSSIQALFHQYFQYGQWKRSVIKIHPRSIKLRQMMPPLLILGIAFGMTSLIFLNFWGLLIPCFYLISVITASVIQKTKNTRQKLILMLVFPTMHFAWGLGFLLGPIRWINKKLTTIE